MDFLQSKSKFKQELKAKYFDRKINAAEQIIEILSYNITVYEQIIQALQIGDEMRSSEVREHISNNITQVNTLLVDYKKLHTNISLVVLYFKIDK